MAKANKIGSVYAELSVRDKMSMGLKSATRALKGFGVNSLKIGAAAGGAMAAGLAVGTKRIIGMGGNLSDLSTQTGVSVASLMRLQQAYKDNGKDANSAGKDIGKMQRAIWEAAQDPGGSMDFFKDIGLSAEELLMMSPEKQFFAIGEALGKVQNQTKRAAVAMDIFGRSGAQLLTVFAGSNLDDINASLGKMPEVMDKFAPAFDRVADLMDRLPNKADQFFTGFSAGVVGQLLPSLEKANGIDFVGLGERLGDAVSTGFQMLTDGTLIDIFALKFTAKFAQLVASVVAAAEAAIKTLGSKEVKKDAESFSRKVVGGWNLIIGDLLSSETLSAMNPEQRERWEKEKERMFGVDRGLDELDRGAMSTTERFRVEMDNAMKANLELIAGANKEADRLFNESKNRALGKKKDAEYMAMSDNIPMIGDLERILGKVDGMGIMTQKESTAQTTFDAIDSAVNSMQARGLSQGGMHVAKEVKDQVSYLKMIYEQLKRDSKKEDPITVF